MSDEKPCPGIGKLPRVGYYGLMTDDGERMYLSRCAWCDKPFHPSKPMPEHTIIRRPGKSGMAYECPVHGRFVPQELPRHYIDQPEAKCMAWLPGGLTYCGRYCPPAKVQS